MPLTIHSPHSGHPVKVRDEDVGRAVRDEMNRIFYVVPRADGSGFYGAVTRKGSPKDEERYDKLAANPVAAAAERTDTAPATPAAPAHDATGGRRRRRPVRRAVLTLLLLGAGALGVAYGLDEVDLLPAAIDDVLPERPGRATPGPDAG